MSQDPKQYPNSDIFERAYLVKLFHNTKLHESLAGLQPSIFLDKKRRFIAFLLKYLYEYKQSLTVDNIFLTQNKVDDEKIQVFMKRNGITKLSESEIHDILYDITVDSSDRLFTEAKRELDKLTFKRFVVDMIGDMKYDNDYNNRSGVIAKAKAIQKVHDIIYSVNGVANDNQLQSAKHLINSADEYIPTSSTALNSYIGGFSRGYVNTLFAKSGQCKSSWADYNIVQNIIHGKINGTIVKITPEEDSTTQYRRIIAMLCNISTTAMLQKIIKITDEHLQVVKDVLKGKLVIIDGIFKYNSIVDLFFSSKDADMIYLDHINSIDFPGTGTWLNNMIGGIPGMVNVARKAAKKVNSFGLRPSIILLSQVADKEIQRSDRLIKAPKYFDCYGSSALYQASRQMIGLWYQYKDFEDNPIAFVGQTTPSINDLQMGIEKSSFSKTGKIALKYDPEHNLFFDSSKIHKKKDDYEPPKEKGLFN